MDSTLLPAHHLLTVESVLGGCWLLLAQEEGVGADLRGTIIDIVTIIRTRKPQTPMIPVIDSLFTQCVFAIHSLSTAHDLDSCNV